ncbi:hypothetical protein FB446DRAFT_722898 [Lentinula raphanica]|nr:hypothetical protein FB446DRAFT_722898 [Lentinula raphanica]
MLFSKLFAGCVLSMTFLGVFASPLALSPRSAPWKPGAGLERRASKTKVEIAGVTINIRRKDSKMYYNYAIVLNEPTQSHVLVLDDSEKSGVGGQSQVSFTTLKNPEPTQQISDPKMQVEVDLTSIVSRAQKYAASSRACVWVREVVNELFGEANGKGMPVDVESTVTDWVFQREKVLGIPRTCPASLHQSSDKVGKPNGLRVDTSHTNMILSEEELEKGKFCDSPTAQCDGTLSSKHTFQPNQKHS